MFLFIFCSCSQRNQYKNRVYIDIYGNYKDRATVKFDNDVIFDKKVNSRRFLDVIRGPIVLNKAEIKIYFSIDSKDTSLIFSLKKNNYLFIGHSDIRHEFQFYPTDSIKFFHSKTD